MAIGWLSVLKSVPWSDVISTAPKVADGARKLWSAVSRKTAPQDAPPPGGAPAFSQDAAVGALEARIGAMEAATHDLHAQMLESSGLIKALADQNAQLIARIESLRMRVWWLFAGLAMTALAAVVALAMVLMRGGG
ncbi:MAG: hypothetical protein HGA47_06000 [Zoogloea sp.]|nr:hypothetical protein [Zoogloea sp.]